MSKINFKDIYDFLKKSKIDKNQIFLSCSNNDREIVVDFIRLLTKDEIKFWCMYDKDGNNLIKNGVNYKKKIDNAIAASRSFICFISNFSIVSSEVHEELIKIANEKKKENISFHQIYLENISLDDIMNIPLKVSNDFLNSYGYETGATIKDLNLFSKESIFGSTGRYSLEAIYDSVIDTYFISMLNSALDKHTHAASSQKLCILTNECLKHPCNAKTISQDMKTSDELDEAHNLQELHILSNELMEYDCNPYSCMIIATNLLGNRDKSSEHFCPNKNGIKYYYYCTNKYLDENEKRVKEKIHGFLTKDIRCKKEVVNLIKNEYCFELDLLPFHKTLNDKGVVDFIERYQIKNSNVIESLYELFDNEEELTIRSRQRRIVCIKQPIDFVKWITGQQGDYDRATVYSYIDFLNKLQKIIGSDDSANKELLNEFQQYVQDLQNMRDIEEWQFDGKEVKGIKQTVKLLLDPNNTCDGNEKFPKLIKWLCSDLTEESCSTEIIDEAMKNLHFISVNDDENLTLSYSYVIYVEKQKTTAMWYTTGYSNASESNKSEDIVIVYEFPEKGKEFNQLLDAFSYMIRLNENAYQELKRTNSNLLSILKNR